jgi:glycine/D-amino acid oxidase-like deaminating enzyme
MRKHEADSDVLVLGGGVIGCGIARILAPDHDVVVVEKGQVAGEASGLSAGLITPTLFHNHLPDVARHINQFFREFDGTRHFSFTERPRLELIVPDQESRARELVDEIQSNNLPVSFLEPEMVEETYPWFDMDRFVGAIEIADAGWIDPYSYTVALKKEAESQGATFETGVAVTDVLVEDGEAAGVETKEGVYRADEVVVAAGWRTRELLADHLEVPVRPYRLQCVTLDPGFDLPDNYPVARVSTEEMYMRPEHNGDLLVGGGEYLENQPRRVTSGIDATEKFKLQVAEVVPSVVDSLQSAEFVDGWAGVDGCTPDSRPIIDAPTEGPDSLYVATGFTGLGMVNSPVAPTAIRALMTDESAPFSLDTFALNRFETRSDDFQLTPNAQL